jgi:hypothetical protein
MEVQTEYLRRSCEDIVAETAKIAELNAGIAKEAFKPLERSPLAGRDRPWLGDDARTSAT